jgi:hypothetical protein
MSDGVGSTLAADGATEAGVVEPDGSGAMLGTGVGVAVATGASGMRPETKTPRTIAPAIAPRTATMEMSDSRSRGIGPEAADAPEPGRIGTPHDRQTCAQAGLARPQL